MGTEEMLETLTERILKEYKKKSHDSVIGQRLNRHEPVEMNGITFTCWKEFIVYKMAEFVSSLYKDIDVDVYIDGNNSTLQVELSDEQQKELNNKMYVLMKKLELA